jgi:hypothetical protein
MPVMDWIRRLGSTARDQPETDSEATKRRHGRVRSGQYRLLYDYLENRYANTVVLTFSEIEDLLGFTLPDLASLRQEWWTNADRDTAGRSYSDAWILASRTARPNLLARNVVFERGS